MHAGLPSVVRVRVDNPPPRGEAGRVAARVRTLLGADEAGATQDTSGPDLPTARVSAWQRLAARVPMRVDPGRRSVIAVGIAVVAAAVLTGVWVLAAQPRTVPVGTTGSTVAGSAPLLSDSRAAPRASSGSAVVRSATPAPPASEVVVDVAGKVHRPGLYRLPPGSRVDDAVRAAGGPVRGVDLSSLNLAAKIVDGQQIAVGQTGAPAPAVPSGPGVGASGGGTGTGATAGGPVDLNTASLEQLETLPGIGPALGQRILDYRTEHGSFTSVDQLDDVSGIGTVTFARLRSLVTV